VFICATRDADKKVFTGFANVAGVERAGFLDRANVAEVFVYYGPNTLDLTPTALSAWPRQHSVTRCQNSRVFDEGRVRVFVIRRQLYELKTARFERGAVCLMLS
jgi:hypothetical protein